MTTLDDRKQLVSDLWLDQPDAHDQIESRVREGRFTAAEAELLRCFTERGYMTLSLGLEPEFSQAFDNAIDEIWEQRPIDLAVGRNKTRISLHDHDGGRGSRIADLHSHSQYALDLYLNPMIHRMIELIFDQRPVAIQSLYFEFGSQQKLHRDPMFVAAKPASHLVACWIALEDISPECGPLVYVPGSHRMPWYEFGDDEIVLTKRKAAEKRQAWNRFRDQQMQEMGLEPAAFTCKRGDVFVWHAGLLHGGKPVQNETLTRKSFVVHYSTAANYKSRTATMKVKSGEQGEDDWRLVRGTTSRVIERNGCAGIDNPLRYAPLPAGPTPSPEVTRQGATARASSSRDHLVRRLRRASRRR